MAGILEVYKDRLAVSEKVYQKAHFNESMSEFKKIIVAKTLENTNKYINEAFDNSTGTQRSDLGMFKRFALNLTTVAIPNLIAYDLVIVYPMSSMTGYINYLQYTTGSNKGATTAGTVLNDPFRLGNVDPTYTSPAIAESHKALAAEVTAHAFTLNWTPVAAVTAVKIGTTSYTILTTGSPVADTSVLVDISKGTITFAAADTLFVADAEVKVLYSYDNVVIPQNDLPLLNVRSASIALTAKARRIAVYYSQMAAFQAKTDYGFDMGDQLAEKAVGELNYEIDTEVTQLLIDNAPADSDLVWSKTLPVGVSKAEHYEGFVEIVEQARQKIYDRTKRFAPNYMIISSSVLPVLAFIKNFTAAPTGNINGPYFAGTLNSLKVFVTPNIAVGHFVIGVNGDDMMSSAAVYAPYMAVIPTQLLGYSDGGMSQGWSTLYDLKMLNADLLVSGRITA